MSKRQIAVGVGMIAGAALLGGCEVLIPLWAATRIADEPYASGYDDSSYYDDYGTYEREVLDVEVEHLFGNVGGRTIDRPEQLLVDGSQYGSSASFALSSEERSSPYALPGDDEILVFLDVCPIDEYASGAPITDPAGSYVALVVCRGEECLDTYGAELDLEVVDAPGERRVLADATWDDGSALTLGLRYGHGSTAP